MQGVKASLGTRRTTGKHISFKPSWKGKKKTVLRKDASAMPETKQTTWLTTDKHHYKKTKNVN